MLGDHPLPGGQVVDLSFLNLLGWLIAQRTTAALARVQAVDFGTIRLLDPLERVPLMSGLSARLALAFLAKALGRRYEDASLLSPSLEGGLLLLREFLAS